MTKAMRKTFLVDNPDELMVRLGDWDLRHDFANAFNPDHGEEYPHLQVRKVSKWMNSLSNR